MKIYLVDFAHARKAHSITSAPKDGTWRNTTDWNVLLFRWQCFLSLSWLTVMSWWKHEMMTMEENMASKRDNTNVFHGFSEEEIHAAFQNCSWRGRNRVICALAEFDQISSLNFATLGSSSSSHIGGLARWPENWPSCGLELVRGGCPPPASCDCSMELGQLGSYLPLLQSPVASKRATVPPRSNPVSDKINPGRCEQQVNWSGRGDDWTVRLSMWIPVFFFDI